MIYGKIIGVGREWEAGTVLKLFVRVFLYKLTRF